MNGPSAKAVDATFLQRNWGDDNTAYNMSLAELEYKIGEQRDKFRGQVVAKVIRLKGRISSSLGRDSADQ
jgi:hypothetical protein